MKIRSFNFLFFLILLIYIASCSLPSNYSIKETPNLTNLIDTNTCYISNLGCTDNFFLVSKFTSSGKVYTATTSSIDADILDCFRDTQINSTLCKNIIEGHYYIQADTIYTQSLRKDGTGFIIFREYLIHTDQDISLISDYIDPKYTRVGFATNYPSFHQNDCFHIAIKRKFH